MLFILTTVKLFAQQLYCPPPNIGFEDGSFNGWTCDTGTVDPVGNINVISSSPVPNRQTMINGVSGAQLDPWGNFPTLCPYGG